MPTDELLPDAVAWMRRLKLEYTTLSEIINAGPCPVVMADIEAGLQRSNTKALSSPQKVQKVALLPHDFTIPTGELSKCSCKRILFDFCFISASTMKIKRAFTEKTYGKIIDSLYRES